MKQGNKETLNFRESVEGTNRSSKKPYKPREFRKVVFKIGKTLPSNRKVRIERYKELSFLAVLKTFEKSERAENRKEERRAKFKRARQK